MCTHSQDFSLKETEYQSSGLGSGNRNVSCNTRGQPKKKSAEHGRKLCPPTLQKHTLPGILNEINFMKGT